MTDTTLSRRELLKTSAVGAIAAAAGCYTQQDDNSVLGPVGAGTEKHALGSWRAIFTDSLEDVERSGTPTVVVITATGEIALFDVEAGMSTNGSGGIDVVAESTLDDVEPNRFPTLAFLLESGETAVITEDTYNG